MLAPCSLLTQPVDRTKSIVYQIRNGNASQSFGSISEWEEISVFAENWKFVLRLSFSASREVGEGSLTRTELRIVIQQSRICRWKQQGKDFEGRESKDLGIQTLFMVSLEKTIGLSGTSCTQQSSHWFGLVSLGRVRRKNANEDSGTSKSSLYGQ